MALVSLREVSVQFGGPPVLDRVSFSVEPGERSCVTGRNGEGKSTLLKVLAGLVPPDSGEIVAKPPPRIAYLAQDVPSDRPGTVRDAMGRDDGAAARFLSQLGLDADAPFNALSGGLRRRVFLAAALAAEPDLLLLDEPTNHLDVESIEWLEQYLKRSRAACLFVTHDRAFLKHVATRVLDLDRGELAGWNCDYATFLRRKQDLLSDEAAYWAKKSKKLKEEEAWIRRGVKARTTRNEGRVAALVALRKEFAARRAAVGTSSLKIDAGAASGDLVVKADGVFFRHPGAGHDVVADFSAKILRGERIGVVGPNGAGKTTLLNLLTGRLTPQQGAVTAGARTTVAYLDQLRTALDPEKTVVENLAEDRDEVTVGGVRKHVYGYLQDFLFTPERARTPVKALSGGERARLVLARRFMEPGNLLVLDEPTNDLDVETLELLEEQLALYTGTILLVSHDREFLDHVATSCFVLPGDGRVLVSAGGYAEAARTLKQAVSPKSPRSGETPLPQGAAQRKSGETPLPQSPASDVRNPTPKARKLSYNEQRELAALPARMETLEKEIAEIEAALADGSLFARDNARACALAERLPAAREELDAAETRWLELSET